MDPAAVVEDFRTQHRLIEQHLAACERLLDQVTDLHARLLEFRPVLLEHLAAKDAFYTQLIEACTRNGDLASTNVAQMFDGNMKGQSGAVRRFFSGHRTAGSPLVA